MKLLQDILYKTGMLQVEGNLNLAIDSIHFNSRKVSKLSLYVAVKGLQVDGHSFIDSAVEMGAHAIVCEELPKELNSKVTYVKVQDSKRALGQISANFYDNPSSELVLVGITGTNGKTTCTSLLYKLYKRLGHKVGLISTVKNYIHNQEVEAKFTTPDAVELNQLLRRMVDEGCKYCFMEVSSHAIDQGRVNGLEYDLCAFTNLTHDHLDYHKTFDDYLKAKKQLFDGLSSEAYALVNKDDKNGLVMTQNTNAEVKTYALKSMADYQARVIESSINGLNLLIANHELWSKMVGGFNAYNLLTVYGIADLLGENSLDVLTVLSSLDAVRGRFEQIKSDSGKIGVVDYAHTPDALKNTIQAINDLKTNDQNLITVIGCGGDRDKTKRPIMGEIAVRQSHKAIFTSDNPRSENPEVILEDMKSGLSKELLAQVIVIQDRKEAIKTACALAGPKDIVLVAGKGHETYQEINGERFHFDDMEVIKEQFQNQ
ncbi:MAG: UDP-N-acetylmuramoyl-L-alanyl-D-glutamate--2,6-diaminopimelate ligase [Flavobacteriales bacterium]|nr:UDP-N-acetylmuramoyl-L-alanyl-D-glutamate--2,6-diaminopimelate ligase [Flavobacteriales bacterium]